jgi:hypothetical protein
MNWNPHQEVFICIDDVCSWCFESVWRLFWKRLGSLWSLVQQYISMEWPKPIPTRLTENHLRGSSYVWMIRVLCDLTRFEDFFWNPFLSLWPLVLQKWILRKSVPPLRIPSRWMENHLKGSSYVWTIRVLCDLTRFEDFFWNPFLTLWPLVLQKWILRKSAPPLRIPSRWMENHLKGSSYVWMIRVLDVSSQFEDFFENRFGS